MHRLIICAALFAAALLGAPPAAAALRVVATVPTLAALAREIAGDAATVSALSLHTQDPHFVDAKPSLVLELNRADLLLAVGLGLESGWLPALQQGARNPKVMPAARGYLDCSTLVQVLDVPATVDRSEGDIHPGGNPHYLYDPRRLARVAAGIGARMALLDPDRTQLYQRRLGQLLARLDETRARFAERIAPFHGAPIVTYHKSWVYLSDWLGLSEVGHLEPKPGIPPTPKHVASLVVAARRAKVRVVLKESYYPDETARVLADKIDARLLVLPGGADFRGGQSATGWLETVAGALERGLSR